MSAKSKKPLDKKVFEDIFTGILGGVAEETNKNYPTLIKKLEEFDHPEDYHLYFDYPLGNCIEAAMRSKLGENAQPNGASRAEFIYRNYTFVQENLEFFITRKEGMACSADKSRYICKAYVRYYLEGTPLGLPYSEADEKNKCFWKPHFWNDEIWLELLDSLVSLYYGNPLKYMEFLKQHFIKEANNVSK